MFPTDDTKFEESAIKSARPEKGGGWSIVREDGWGFFVPAESPVAPTPGMQARFYGAGIGFGVRGLFLDGRQVFYRTEAADKEHEEIQRYGADATDWLGRWDAGSSVWSIEMGGLGPGYEQCIHITCAEILRHMLKAKYDGAAWLADKEAWERDREAIKRASFDNEVIDGLGLSGAQYGAALNIASQIYRRGPRAVMTDEAVKDRHIQVSKNFPGSR